MSQKKVLFVASMGGHMSELLCLKPLYDDYDSYLVTEKTETTLPLKDTFKDRIFYLSYGTKAFLFKYLFIFAWNCIKSFYLFWKIKPKVIITTGAHTAVPLCFIGKLFRRKVIFIETFANSSKKTLAGKLVYPIADLFVVQWESMLEFYPKAVYWGWIY